MRILKISVLISLALTLSFCGNDKKTSDPSSDAISKTEAEELINLEDEDLELIEIDGSEVDETYPEPALAAKFKNEKIANVYKEYSKLQNAFVNSNPKTAAKQAPNLMKAMEAMGVDASIIANVNEIYNSNDIELQREQFVPITKEVEKMLANALDSGAIYKMYCPMAFNNTGAYWLSSDKQVQNPYFGDKMMRCGRVDSAIE
jgi:hypothetical protein